METTWKRQLDKQCHGDRNENNHIVDWEICLWRSFFVNVKYPHRHQVHIEHIHNSYQWHHRVQTRKSNKSVFLDENHWKIRPVWSLQCNQTCKHHVFLNTTVDSGCSKRKIILTRCFQMFGKLNRERFWEREKNLEGVSYSTEENDVFTWSIFEIMRKCH